MGELLAAEKRSAIAPSEAAVLEMCLGEVAKLSTGRSEVAVVALPPWGVRCSACLEAASKVGSWPPKRIWRGHLDLKHPKMLGRPWGHFQNSAETPTQ